MTSETVSRKPLRVRHQAPKMKRSLIAPQVDVDFNYPPTIAQLKNGFLNAESYDQEVLVTFKAPIGVDIDFDTITIMVDDAVAAENLSFEPNAEAEVSIGTTWFPEERDATNPYVVKAIVDMGPNGSATSLPLNVMVDLTPPSESYLLSPIEFPDVAEGAALTPIILDRLNDVLTGQIGGYEGLVDGDSVQPYMGNTPSGLPVIIDIAAVRVDKLIYVDFSRILLESAPSDALTPFTYTVTDPAGNTPATSPPRNILISLLDAPSALKPPGVPAFDADANPDPLITEAEARAGVIVTIPSYTNAQAKDQVVVSWGATPIEAVTLTADDILEDPMINILLDYGTVHGENGSAVGPSDVAVTYKIVRNGAEQEKSPANDVVVDLTQAGGPDPTPETPWNENLGLPIAKGASGTDNDITTDDAENIIDVRIPVKNVATPPADAFIAGDLIDIWWGGKNVFTGYEVLDTDLVATEFTVSLPEGAIVGISGGPAVQVHYTASRLLSDSTTRNVSTSPDQLVKVASTADLPGQGVLDEGKYEIAKTVSPTRDAVLAYIMYFGGKPTTGEIYPPLGHFAFEIPPYANMAAGDEITVTVGGYARATLPHEEVLPDQIVVTEEHVRVLLADDLENPLVFEIKNELGDYFASLVPPVVGDPVKKTFGGRTSYVVKNAAGSVESAPVDIDYDMRQPSDT